MKIQKALEQIKQYIDLGQYERYVELVLQELYLAGKFDELLDGLMREKKDYLTEEQLIEREKVSSEPVTNSSEIL